MQSSFYLKYGKRTFDIIASSVGLLFLAPLFIIIPLIIKLSDRGPIFFKQKRVGQNFKPFLLIKFRTMLVNADKLGPMITKGDDYRITKIGKFLRKTKLDELPQLINVLKGDISLVGPRPEVEKYVKLFESDYKEILKLKPGITDYASIEFRNEESILKKYDDIEKGYVNWVLPKKIELYKKYLCDVGFFTDIILIFKTIVKIMRG